MVLRDAGTVSLAILSLLHTCCAQGPTRTQTFLSNPTTTALAFDVLRNENPSALDEGYIFITPYKDVFAKDTPNYQWGPHIFDIEGNLIWQGNHTVKTRAWQLQVCNYNGQMGNHLCYLEGYFTGGGGHTNGYVKVLDNTYTEVRQYEAVGELRDPNGHLVGPDGHELNTAADPTGQTILTDLYQPVRRELVAYGGPQEGYVLNGCLQDRDMDDGHVIFEWCSLDHIPIEETFIYLKDTTEWTQFSGKGAEKSPWDYLHINAVDRDAYGDYYVSGKNTNAVYKIAGPKSAVAKPGEVIWKLGGIDNSFVFQGKLHFSFQHHARVLNVTNTTTIISLFDNAWPGGNPDSASAKASSGKIIEVNNVTMTARLVEHYVQPNGRLSPVEGAVQRLPNGNVFVGWGPNQYVSEHVPGLPGRAIYYAKFGDGMALESYRNFKLPWKGYPTQPPDVFAYSENCTSAIAVYMSWNGATEHVAWKIFLSDGDDKGTQVQEGVHGAQTADFAWERTGFETVAGVPPPTTFKRSAYVQAIDKDGKILGSSQHVEVFIPRPTVAQQYNCDNLRCKAEKFRYLPKDSMASECVGLT